jgi:hypothetical protein
MRLASVCDLLYYPVRMHVFVSGKARVFEMYALLKRMHLK